MLKHFFDDRSKDSVTVLFFFIIDSFLEAGKQDFVVEMKFNLVRRRSNYN